MNFERGEQGKKNVREGREKKMRQKKKKKNKKKHSPEGGVEKMETTKVKEKSHVTQGKRKNKTDSGR